MRIGPQELFSPPGPSQWELARCGPTPPAAPARRPHYVIPGSHWLDPAYYQMPRWTSPFTFGFPVPRTPWPFESETRAAGTGLIMGPVPCPPCPPTAQAAQPFVRPAWAQKALTHG